MRLARFRSTIFALLAVACVTFLCYRIAHADATIAALALFLTVLFTGANARIFETVVASVAATLCLDYFFIPPVGSITITDPQGWIALVMFLTASLFATHLSTSVRRQRNELISSHRELEKLYALSRSMLLSGGEDVHRLIINKCIELFGFREVALFESATGQIHRSQRDSLIPDEKLQQVSRYGSVEQEEGTGTTVAPINLGNKNLGSLAFREVSLPEATLQALVNTVAVGLAQAHAHEAGTRAEVVRKSEELKSTMIDALAHELKTPLTSMQAAAETLTKPSLSTEQRHDLLEVIQQETEGLKRMLDEAIHLARIDAKKLKLECQPIEVGELIQAVLSSLREQLAPHRIDLQIPSTLPPVLVDKELMVQALKQLLDNAAKYSVERAVISIAVTEANDLLSISVRDRGPGLTEIEQGRVFDKFYRGRYDRSAVQGTGMGLAIAKEITEAHGGFIAVESQVGQGSRFTITLNAATREAIGVAEQPV
ncbi:MAG: DUF4118 domain-containing protein [Acidobacteriaceae bacterium]|nr:DUF4118 domain-containing protein [Acidobacteriaceae bacterium]MBV9781819.1 DUF4118 domain-containing protein [Acidobacteriaceae bacterium]